MSRRVLEVLDLDQISEVAFPEPVRLVFAAPRRGGPRVANIRTALVSQGRLRLSGTVLHTFADLDPGTPEQPLIALDTVVRDDTAGLQRMLLSVLPHVDEIVLGVDGRSDLATLKVAQDYADCVYVFEALDIGMAQADWDPSETNPRGKIDFAAARNLGRARVRAPWALVVDSDEYMQTQIDVREFVRKYVSVPLIGIDGENPVLGAFKPNVVVIQDGERIFESCDFQRLALTRYRWQSAVHNQLVCSDAVEPPLIALDVISDNNLRTEAEQALRDAQRNISVETLASEAAAGNLNALFHLAKHKLGAQDVREAVALVEDFRLRCEPNSVLAWKRQWLAIGLGFRFYNKEGDLQEANRWAVRALLDGPSIAAFCLLGDIAEDSRDLQRALAWYEAACAITDRNNLVWPAISETRWGRLAGLRLANSSADAREAALKMLADEDTTVAGPDSGPSGASGTPPMTGT